MKKTKNDYELFEQVKNLTHDFYTNDDGKIDYDKYYNSLDVTMGLTMTRVALQIMNINKSMNRKQCRKMVDLFFEKGVDKLFDDYFDKIQEEIIRNREEDGRDKFNSDKKK